MGFGGPGCRAGADRVGRKGLAGWAESGWKGERPGNFRELEWTCEVFKGTVVDFDRWAGIDRTGEEEKLGVVRQTSKIGLEA
jgi:hypothetical protein